MAICFSKLTYFKHSFLLSLEAILRIFSRGNNKKDWLIFNGAIKLFGRDSKYIKINSRVRDLAAEGDFFAVCLLAITLSFLREINFYISEP